jgi:hypothetical protein
MMFPQDKRWGMLGLVAPPLKSNLFDPAMAE